MRAVYTRIASLAGVHHAQMVYSEPLEIQSMPDKSPGSFAVFSGPFLHPAEPTASRPGGNVPRASTNLTVAPNRLRLCGKVPASGEPTGRSPTVSKEPVRSFPSRESWHPPLFTGIYP
jgi:hypothetical protein